MLETKVEELEELAQHLEMEMAAARLMSQLFTAYEEHASMGGRLCFLWPMISENPGLLAALVDDDAQALQREWSEVVKGRQTDIVFLHGMSTVYLEQAHKGLMKNDPINPCWVVGTVLWALLLSSKKFWNRFSDNRVTVRESGERVRMDSDLQEKLFKEALQCILTLHGDLCSRSYAESDYDRSRLHLYCLDLCMRGQKALLAELKELGYYCRLALDKDMMSAIQNTAAEIVDNWCMSCIREAEKTTEDAKAISRLPQGITKNYEGGIQQLEPLVALGVPLKRVLRTCLEWYNEWLRELYVSRDFETMKELIASSSELVEQLTPLCTKTLSHTPENQTLSMHFLFKGFSKDNPEDAIKEYEEALAWNFANQNAKELLGGAAQAVLMKHLDTVIEHMQRNQFTEAYEVLDSIEEHAEEKDQVRQVRAVVCFNHAQALGGDGNFKEALKVANKALQLKPEQDEIKKLVSIFEELAPEEDNLRSLKQAQEAFEEDDYKRAIVCSSKVKANSEYAEQSRRLRSACHFHLGIEAANDEKIEEAKTQLKKALALNDDEEESKIISSQLEAVSELNNVKSLSEAQQAMEDKDYDLAIEKGKWVLSSSKYHKHARHLLSAAYFNRAVEAGKKGDYFSAGRDLDFALRFNDDEEERSVIRKQMEIYGREEKRTETLYEEILEIPPRSDVDWINMAQEELKAGNPQKAISLLSSVDKNTNYQDVVKRLSSAALFQIAIEEAKQGDIKSSLARLDAAYALNDDKEEKKIIKKQRAIISKLL